MSVQGELAVVQRAGLDPQRVGLHGNNKSVEELREALTIGVGRIIVDSFDEIARLGEIAEELRIRPRVMVRATTESKRTPMNTSPRRMRIRSSASRSLVDRRLALYSRHRHPWLDLIGIHSHRLADLRRRGVRGRGTAYAPAAGRFRSSDRRSTGRTGPRGGFGIAYTSADTIHTRCPGGGTSGDHRPRMLSTRHNRPAPLHRAGSRDQWSEHVRPLPRRHSQARRAGRRCEPSLRSSRRRDE